MKRLVFDLETDGLLDEVSVVHSLIIADLDTGEVFSCTDHTAEGRTYYSLQYGFEMLQTADVLYGHNILSYDIPVLQKLYPAVVLKAKINDTFIIAAMRFAHIKDRDFADPVFPKNLAGRHSLKAWGYRLRNLKDEYKGGWKDWSVEMQSYGEQDVATTVSLVKHLAASGLAPEAVETELALRVYLDQQERNGWPFNLEAATELQATLSARREALADLLRQEFGSWTISLGMFTPKVNSKKFGYVKGVPVEKTKLITFNPGSRAHIADRLQTLYGWKPEEFTNTGLPKVDEVTLNGLDYPPVKLLTEFLLVEKRLGQVSEGKEGWLRHATTNAITRCQHIHHRVIQSGAITHRAAHASPNLGQVPKVGSKYGAECRALFYVPAGWLQVGADASGLEARGLGHYVTRYDGGAYARLLLEGDVHSANQQALGLPEGLDEDGMKYRDRAKTWFYAWLYGAGDEKLGKILAPKAPKGKWKSIGKEKKDAFLKATPALAYLIRDVKLKTVNPGYVKGLDGRRVYIRSEHAALNSLIQSAGAVICKKWIVNYAKRLTAELGPQGWSGQWAALGWIHDEVQIAVRPEVAEHVCRVLVEEMEKLTQHFTFLCPLTGDAKIGRNWMETH